MAQCRLQQAQGRDGSTIYAQILVHGERERVVLLVGKYYGEISFTQYETLLFLHG
jgi:hypothetical protein